MKDASSVVGCVQEVSPLGLEISNLIIKIVSVNGKSDNFSALVDTGSPISFVHSTVHKEFCGDHDFHDVSTTRYIALNDAALPTAGACNVKFGLALIPDKEFNMRFEILINEKWFTPFIIDRDFFIQNKISLTCKLYEQDTSNRLSLLNDVASVQASEIFSDAKATVHQFKSDFG